MVNYFLQGDPYKGMVHFTRFFLNTILGMGGLIDVAGMANPQLQRVEPHRFGSTLGHYGVGYGPYVQLVLWKLYPARRRRRYGRWLVSGALPADPADVDR